MIHVLVRVVCDGVHREKERTLDTTADVRLGCTRDGGTRIVVDPDIKDAGWKKRSGYYTDEVEYFCPECASMHPQDELWD